MNLLIDTNVLLDVLAHRQPHFEASLKIWRLCETNAAHGFVSVLSFANIVYIQRKNLSPESVRELWNKLESVFSFVDLTAEDMSNATKNQGKDFEDTLQAVTAVRLRADYIITRNKQDFVQCKIPCLAPTELCGLFAV